MRTNYSVSTDYIDKKDRLNYWLDAVCDAYAPCTVSNYGEDNFHASLEVMQFGATEISRVSSNSIQYKRTPSNIRNDQENDFYISLMASGYSEFTQNGKSVIQKQGDILIYDSALPYNYNFPLHDASILIKIPRSLLKTKSNQLDTLGGTLISSQTAHAKMIASFIQGALAISTETELQFELYSSTMDAIVTGLACATNQRNKNTGKQTALLNKIKSYIKSNISDEQLNLESIAKANHISVRSLCRIFNEEGETPKGWLQSERLIAAYECLSVGKAHSITDIAYSFGFKDLSHFSRAFKNRYGISPSAVNEKDINTTFSAKNHIN
jgi:AraC family transcriptional activator of tynA and feaB